MPGNLIGTAKYLDLTGTVTTANRHIDLRSCRIVRCLALYPADPLPDLAFHAPLLPDYPEGCDVEEEATLGCHQVCIACWICMCCAPHSARWRGMPTGAPWHCMSTFIFWGTHQAALYPLDSLRSASHERTAMYSACLLSHVRVRRFLLECGTRLRDAAPETWRGGDPLEAEALRLMEAEVCAEAPSTRGAICRRGTASVVRCAGGARLLNRHHHRLLRARAPDDPRVCAAGAAPPDEALLLRVLRRPSTLLCSGIGK